jgi:hypothetical protein
LSELPDLKNRLSIARESQQHLAGVVEDLKAQLARAIAVPDTVVRLTE